MFSKKHLHHFGSKSYNYVLFISECNYNVLAMIEDGSIYMFHPNCQHSAVLGKKPVFLLNKTLDSYIAIKLPNCHFMIAQ